MGDVGEEGERGEAIEGTGLRSITEVVYVVNAMQHMMTGKLE